MKSRATPRFWAAYRELPAEVRDAAQKAYRLFRENPKHPSLQFKKVHDREPVYSVRVTVARVGGYRFFFYSFEHREPNLMALIVVSGALANKPGNGGDAST